MVGAPSERLWAWAVCLNIQTCLIWHLLEALANVCVKILNYRLWAPTVTY